MTKHRKNQESGKIKSVNSDKMSAMKAIIMIAPLVGIALGIFYVVKKDQLFSNSEYTIELSKKELESTLKKITAEIRKSESSEEKISDKVMNEIIQQQLDQLFPKTEATEEPKKVRQSVFE